MPYSPASPLSSVSTFNTLSIPSLRAQYLSPSTKTLHALPPSLHLTLESSTTLSRAQLTQCFELVRCSSARDYEASSMGWSPAKKRKEMRLPDLRYLILTQRPPSGVEDTELDVGQVVGFMSFMLTWEDGNEVVYCYEVHLAQEIQGRGVGKVLMAMMEEVGRGVGVEKAMLTVFKANGKAVGFYEGLGYGVDKFSPGPRKLRGGVVKDADYIILSKRLVRSGEEGGEGKRKAG